MGADVADGGRDGEWNSLWVHRAPCSIERRVTTVLLCLVAARKPCALRSGQSFARLRQHLQLVKLRTPHGGLVGNRRVLQSR